MTKQEESDLLRENEELKKELKTYKESPIADVYRSIHNQITHWSNELEESPVALSSANEESDARAFEKADRFIVNILKYIDQLSLLRQKMSPGEIKDISEQGTSLIDDVRASIKKGG